MHNIPIARESYLQDLCGMEDQQLSVTRKAMDFIYAFYEKQGESFIYHNYDYVTENVRLFRKIARKHGLTKEEYHPALLAIAFKDIGLPNHTHPELDNLLIVNEFIRQNQLSTKQCEQLRCYLDLFQSGRKPLTIIEQILADSADIHLAYPDALERIHLMRIEHGAVRNRSFSDIEWLQHCKRYFVEHKFHTRYAVKKYGLQRSKNYFELERRLEKLQLETSKLSKPAYKEEFDDALSFKETEDLFRASFRNYISLISAADRKAGLLIHVNAIIASVVIGFSFRQVKTSALFILPTGAILVVALGTMFFSVLASKPQERLQKATEFDGKKLFFFGSFDRVDNDFIRTSWDMFKDNTRTILDGNKMELFRHIMQETYLVRKVLAKKFFFLSIAFKIFMYGLVVSMIGYLVVFIIKQ